MIRTFLVSVALCLIAVGANAVEIIAHRGASGDAPENTLASVRLGWQQQADAVEIDVHLSADGQIVVLHDGTTKRIGGRDRAVASQTLAELQELDVGSWKDAKYAGQRVPTLAQVLDTIPPGKRVFIEVKVEAEIVPELERTLEKAGRAPDETVVIGFSYDAMQAVKQRLPAIQVYWLVSLERDKQTGEQTPTTAAMIEKAKAAGFDGLNLGNSPPLEESDVRQIQQAGLGLFVWTVNDPANARRYQELGLDGITTDHPARMRKELGLEAAPE